MWITWTSRWSCTIRALAGRRRAPATLDQRSEAVIPAVANGPASHGRPVQVDLQFQPGGKRCVTSHSILAIWDAVVPSHWQATLVDALPPGRGIDPAALTQRHRFSLRLDLKERLMLKTATRSRQWSLLLLGAVATTGLAGAVPLPAAAATGPTVTLVSPISGSVVRGTTQFCGEGYIGGRGSCRITGSRTERVY
ncbi:MAG: hypothetical protein QOG10_4570 [Kribbellaceae bacterium]|jgi:hypothetical protein|nr:hypothetical protein [Kribbellaceae bacterium]